MSTSRSILLPRVRILFRLDSFDLLGGAYRRGDRWIGCEDKRGDEIRIFQLTRRSKD